jgi:curved DNA-binding protein
MLPEGFVDYYELLQISPNAEYETIQRVYRMLAQRYHPDNPETGDPDKIILLNLAHQVLSDPSLRAAYDLEYQQRHTEPIGVFELKEFAAGIDGEANRRMGILCLLYNKRRTNPDHPGISILEFEAMMSLPREHLMFALWYLKEAHFVRQAENSDYVISGSGVDYVETHLPSNRLLYRMLKAAESGATRTTAREYWYQDSGLRTGPGPDAKE